MRRGRPGCHLFLTASIVVTAGSFILAGCGDRPAPTDGHDDSPSLSWTSTTKAGAPATTAPVRHCEYPTSRVPNVVGLTASDAEDALDAACLESRISFECPNTVPGNGAPGIVWRQSFDAGTVTSTFVPIVLTVCRS